jgi:hypothetical protein
MEMSLLFPRLDSTETVLSCRAQKAVDRFVWYPQWPSHAQPNSSELAALDRSVDRHLRDAKAVRYLSNAAKRRCFNRAHPCDFGGRRRRILQRCPKF